MRIYFLFIDSSYYQIDHLKLDVQTENALTIMITNPNIINNKLLVYYIFGKFTNTDIISNMTKKSNVKLIENIAMIAMTHYLSIHRNNCYSTV